MGNTDIMDNFLVTANIATTPDRYWMLEKVIASIHGQFDMIRVYVNSPGGLIRPPDFLLQDGITITLTREDLTDNGKFYFLDKIERREMYFTLDDDFIYPKNYVSTMLGMLQKHKGCVVTHHGRILTSPNADYYNSHKCFHLLHRNTEEIKIDVCGTACAAFDTGFFKPVGLAQCERKLMSDLNFSLIAAQQKVPIIVCKHDYGWIQAIETPKEHNTIFKTFKGKPTPIQNLIANKIYNENYTTENA